MEVNAVHCKEGEVWQTEIGRLIYVEIEDAKWKMHDLGKEVRIDAKFGTNRDKFMDLMTGLEMTSDGHFGRVSVAKHGIELSSGENQTAHTTLSREGPRASEFENTDFDRMLKLWGTDPDGTGWADPVIFAPKKKGLLRSASIIEGQILFLYATTTLFWECKNT